MNLEYILQRNQREIKQKEHKNHPKFRVVL